jgi:hypothetical protein
MHNWPGNMVGTFAASRPREASTNEFHITTAAKARTQHFPITASGARGLPDEDGLQTIISRNKKSVTPA